MLVNPWRASVTSPSNWRTRYGPTPDPLAYKQLHEPEQRQLRRGRPDYNRRRCPRHQEPGTGSSHRLPYGMGDVHPQRHPLKPHRAYAFRAHQDHPFGGSPNFNYPRWRSAEARGKLRPVDNNRIPGTPKPAPIGEPLFLIIPGPMARRPGPIRQLWITWSGYRVASSGAGSATGGSPPGICTASSQRPPRWPLRSRQATPTGPCLSGRRSGADFR